MFKLFFIYPVVLLILLWIASDVQVGASVYSFEDNFIEIEFPKEKFRSEDNSDPWYSFSWNGESARDEFREISDAVVN